MRSTDLVAHTKSLFPLVSISIHQATLKTRLFMAEKLDPGVDLLSKPYTREALARKIRHVLNNAKQQKTAIERLTHTASGAPGNGIAVDRTNANDDQSARILVVED